MNTTDSLDRKVGNITASLLANSLKVAEGKLAFLMTYKSIEEYGRRLRGLTRGLWKGILDRPTFESNIFQLMRRQFTLAWNEGARVCGIEPGDRTPEEQLKLDDMTLEQAQFIPGLADWITSHSDFWLSEDFVAPTVQEPPPIEPEEEEEPEEEPPIEPEEEPQVFSEVTDPKVFDWEVEPEELREWGDENLHNLEDVSDIQQEMLEDYQIMGYEETNQHLRTGAGDPLDFEEGVEIMDTAMAPLDKELTVYRGAINVPEGMLEVGTEFVDDAFLSTSLDVSQGMSFADSPTATSKVIYQIELPSDVSGVFMNTDLMEQEVEVLLERGLRLRVVEDLGLIEGDYGDIRFIRLEVVGRG